MTAEAIHENNKLDVGRVLSGTFQVIGRNLLSFTILGFVLSGLPTGIIAFLQARSLGGMDFAGGNVAFDATYFTTLGYGVLVAVITTAILQGALIYATVQDLNGQKPQVGEALAMGLRNFLPLLAVTILFVLAVGAGMILLIVPGIMIACAWCVAVPSLVADRTGIFGAFGRSAELTRGNRWRVFALFVLLWVILLILGMVFSSVMAAAVFSQPGALQNPMAAASNPVAIVIQVVQQTIQSVIGAALVAVLYVELRRAREGAGPQWLSEIFS